MGTESGAAKYKWKEISGLPDDIDSLRDRELESLSEVWAREKERLGDDKRIAAFSKELEREWAIETGIIEGVYTLDRGITQTLIERGIDSSYIAHDSTNRDPELVARIIQSHADVIEGLFAFVIGERELTPGDIKELHTALLRYQDSVVVFDPAGRAYDVPLEKGVYRRTPNNPLRPDGTLHEYCPPEHVAAEMDRLIGFYGRQMALRTPTHVEAAWLHHVFTQIHPFQDGNGRVARTLASLVFIKDGYFPLVVNRDDREKYIDTLESADQGDLTGLIRLFSQLQKRALTKAIGTAADVKPAASVEDALAATRDMLIDLGRVVPTGYETSKTMARTLANRTMDRFNAVAEILRRDISAADSAFEFSTGFLEMAPLHELGTVAEKLKYDPNPAEYHQSVQLILKARNVESEIVISFHGIGAAFRGVLVASAYFQVAGGAVVFIAEDIFRISYQEAWGEIWPRFTKWLDSAIIEGIANWRRSLV